MLRYLVITLHWLLLFMAPPAIAQRHLKNIPDPDPELERQALIVDDQFEINLFAADPRIAKPIHMNFDSRGRLWLASSEIYPHIKPGQKADDKILILEDQDGDGRADKTTVFASRLLIPTGVLPGDGGAYVANSTELLHLSDTDGDGQSDRRRIVLSGFGTEDTHHILHTLRWGPDGLLYMNQSIYIHSHIETPYGVRRMNGSGIWHFRPETMQLEPYTLGLVNPWGHYFDRYGQSFATDGAGGHGINYLFPGFVGVTSPGAKRVLHGLNPGSPKYCGLEIVGGRHLPAEWQGNLVTNDFRAHRVCRFEVRENGSGFASIQKPDLVKSQHPAFRPVDIKQGPDGAIYIADWYNPIIQHGEVDFRDPRRDHVHGRIWRITAKNRPVLPKPRLADASVSELLDSLKSTEPWTRDHAKQELKRRGRIDVESALSAWIKNLGASDPDTHLLEALWTYQSINVVRPELVRRLLLAKDHRIRAAATRVLYHWSDRMPNALNLLSTAVVDAHPRVRLEAVRALSRIPEPTACQVAMRGLDLPTDPFLDFALWQTARDLESHWLPALEIGDFDFGDNRRHLTFALSSIDSPRAVPLLISEWNVADPPDAAKLLAMIAKLANPQHLQVLLDSAISDPTYARRRPQIFAALATASSQRKVRPAGQLDRLSRFVESNDVAERSSAMRLAGEWKLESLRPILTAAAIGTESDPATREAAMDGLTRLGGEESIAAFRDLFRGEVTDDARMMAIAGWAVLDVKSAAQESAKWLTQFPANLDPSPIFTALLKRKNGPESLLKELNGKTLDADVAKLSLRAVRSAGRGHDKLIASLTASAGLTAGPRRLTPAELEKMINDVRDDGDPARGEEVYRRQELACQKCHAIGGAGGRVGPDMASIGGSAPIDYLIESLLEPNKKIKENYHSLTVVTDEGQVISGVFVRENNQHLILRDAEDRELRIPKDSIEDRKQAGSLMPAGLSDSLTRPELVDLVRFLSELGKVGPYAISTQRFARRWQILAATKSNRSRVRSLSFEEVARATDLQWAPLYSHVDGAVRLEEISPFVVAGRGLPIGLIRLELEVTAPEPDRVGLRIDGPEKYWIWFGKKELAASDDLSVVMPSGKSTITLGFRLDPTASRRPTLETVRVELIDVADSKARAQFASDR